MPQVNPALYGGDKSTRAFTMWLGNRGTIHGCYNINCPGFVHTNKATALDHVFDTKPYFSYTGFAVNQDEKGNWWLGLGEHFDQVGYWPKELFTDLSKGATYMELGGQVYTGEYNKYWSEMGHGGSFDRHYRGNGLMFQVLFMNNLYIATIPGENDALVQLHAERCYVSKDNSFKGSEEGYSFLYAGGGKASDKCFGA
ncbi:hypothetical protein AQUCO_01400186v1 [Aquilegia coerulea]|uniref:Neprosin PEP catalytic domain-containing protein n=1 Tax=Aquilegia coerulea TaxID=218851 RepID=A0A2G5DV06_AQUCA|nr:hypothetical protein AQUCO_01400186v1 [Aquilegia coerulea]